MDTSKCKFIFVTVGTDHHPFNRLVASVETWLNRQSDAVDCFMQIGTSAKPSRARWVDYLPYEEMERTMRLADVVVCHGGPGTIMLARYWGHLPIVVPRTRALGEHVDNHQVLFGRRMAGEGVVRLAEDEPTLHSALDTSVIEEQRIGQATADESPLAVQRFTALVNSLLVVKD